MAVSLALSAGSGYGLSEFHQHFPSQAGILEQISFGLPGARLTIDDHRGSAEQKIAFLLATATAAWDALAAEVGGLEQADVPLICEEQIGFAPQGSWIHGVQLSVFNRKVSARSGVGEMEAVVVHWAQACQQTRTACEALFERGCTQEIVS